MTDDTSKNIARPRKGAFSRLEDQASAALDKIRAAPGFARPLPGHYRILSIDGGGLRGIIPLVILDRLDQAKPGWRDAINMFAGTSTGGLIALGLAAGKSPRELLDVYVTRGPEIFRTNFWHTVTNVVNLMGSKYDPENRESIIHQILGDKRLKDYLRENDTKGHVCIPAFNLAGKSDPKSGTRTWSAKIFHNMPVGDGTNDGTELASDVAMRTSAAPTYFPSFQGHVDGGVFANNPSMCALAQVLDTRLASLISPDAIRMLSLGTGYTATHFDNDENWGLAQWMPHLVDLLTDGVLEVANFQVRQLLDSDKYLRVTVPLLQNIPMDDPGMIGKLQQTGNEEDISPIIDFINQW